METKRRKTAKSDPTNSWREKVEPVFVEWWSCQKRAAELPKTKDPNKLAEWREDLDRLKPIIDEARQQKQRIAGPLFEEIYRGMKTETRAIAPERTEHRVQMLASENPESSEIFRLLVFLKYGLTFRELIVKVDFETSRGAHLKLMAVHGAYWKLLKEGFEAIDKLKLKFNARHFFIITDGLDFGMDKLTPEELADCLDEICPCGQPQPHSVDYFKRVRREIKQACARYGQDRSGSQRE